MNENNQYQLLGGRCWKGYEPTPGVKAYAKGSCRLKAGKRKRSTPRKRKRSTPRKRKRSTPRKRKRSTPRKRKRSTPRKRKRSTPRKRKKSTPRKRKRSAPRKRKRSAPRKRKRKRKKSIPRSRKYYRSTASGAGMTKAGVAAYRRANPGSKLRTAVTGKVKRGSKNAARRRSFCARSRGWTGPRGKAARRRWKC